MTDNPFEILHEIAEREKQREIDRMVEQGADRELIEWLYDRCVEGLLEEMDNRLLRGTRDDERNP